MTFYSHNQVIRSVSQHALIQSNESVIHVHTHNRVHLQYTALLLWTDYFKEAGAYEQY